MKNIICTAETQFVQFSPQNSYKNRDNNTFVKATMFLVLYCVSMHILSGYAYESIEKYYEIELTNGYEEGVVGVHLKNKKQQDKAMEMFVAGNTRCPLRELNLVATFHRPSLNLQD